MLFVIRLDYTHEFNKQWDICFFEARTDCSDLFNNTIKALFVVFETQELFSPVL